MLKKFLAAMGVGSAEAVQPQDGPYAESNLNFMYHLLFCDDPQLFGKNRKGKLEHPWTLVLSPKLDVEGLRKLAGDPSAESRLRMLAYNRLRSASQKVPAKQLLGTIVEVGLPEGLDTLAAYADGSSRYINHSGKMVIVEGTPNSFEKEIENVLVASKPIVDAIGPWEKARLPAPKKGNFRMTFLVSDGLYFGEGAMTVVQKDPMAGPLVSAATDLLLKLIRGTEAKGANPGN